MIEKYSFNVGDFNVKHIGIIMDGNGRWAQKKGKPRSFGHFEGAKKFREIVHYCNKIGLKYLTVYAFSTENWKRPKFEVDFLINLFKNQLTEALRDFADENIVVNFLGYIKKFPQKLVLLIDKIVKISEKNTGLKLNIALNYGGRSEILNAIKKIYIDLSQKNFEICDLSEETFSKYLYTKSQPNPDIIIRTGGEMRVSNFLLWQSAYSEYFFTKTLWPNFTKEEFETIIQEFSKRKRNYGGIN